MGVLFMMPQWDAVSEGWLQYMLINISHKLTAVATNDTKGDKTWQGRVPAFSLHTSGASVKYFSRLSKYFGLTLKTIPPQPNNVLVSILEKLPVTQIFCQYGTYAVDFMNAWQRTDTPLFIHFHGYDAEFDLRLHDKPQQLVHPKKYLEDLLELQKRATFITNSSSAKLKLTDAGLSSERIIVKYYGIPIPPYKKEHHDQENIKIIHLGRLIDCKSPDRTIKAFELARSRGLDAQLMIVGDGPLRSMCELIRLRSPYKDSIVIKGSVDSSTAKDLLFLSDVLTQHNITGEITHQTESLGASILEAMAFGLPVVGTKNGGVLETVVHGETGFLNEPGDVEAQAESFIELARNPDLRQAMGEAGRKRVAEHFSPEQEKNQLIQILGL